MKKYLVCRHPVLSAGALISIIFLGIFMVLQNMESPAMKLEIHWLAFAALPVFAALLVGGYITKVDAFGISFERAMNEPAEPEAHDDPAVVTVEGDSEKESHRILDVMSDEVKAQKRQLKFRTEKSGFYNPVAIKRYLRQLPNIKSILVLRQDGGFVGSLDNTTIVADENHPDVAKIEKLIELLEDGNPQSFSTNYQDAFSEHKLLVGTTISDAYKYCLENDLDRVPVVDKQGIYKGVFTRNSLASSIANKAIAAQSG